MWHSLVEFVRFYRVCNFGDRAFGMELMSNGRDGPSGKDSKLEFCTN